MDEQHNSAVIAMAVGITVFCVVLMLAPIIMFTIKRMTNEIQVYATEALEKQKVIIAYFIQIVILQKAFMQFRYHFK